MNILVTGTNGFVGRHLSKELKKQGHIVVGTGLDGVAVEIKDVVDEYVENVDLTNQDDVNKLPIKSLDAVINLAALAQVGASFGKQEEYNRVNTLVQTNIAEIVQKQNPSVRLVAISTGAVYDSQQTMPLTEESKLATNASPYALSKVAMENALMKYVDMGLNIIVARPFNHIGPGQMPGFLLPDLANQLKKRNTVTVGNIKTKRDYTDVRDVVKAYALLATNNKLNSRTYNVCSGVSITGGEILGILAAAINKTDVEVVVDESRLRPNDPVEIYGDYTKLANDTGWRPIIPLEQTIKDFVESMQFFLAQYREQPSTLLDPESRHYASNQALILPQQDHLEEYLLLRA